MKNTAIIVALVLITLAISFALVRMDVLDADTLRFLPAVLGVIVAGAFVFIGIQRGKTRAKVTEKRVE